MNRALNPKDCVARLYVPRSEVGGGGWGERGLISVKDCVDQALISLRSYVPGSDEKLLQAARNGDKELHKPVSRPRALKTEGELNIRPSGKRRCCMASCSDKRRMRAMRKPGHG